MRELWELAAALSNLGYWVRINSTKRSVTIYRDGEKIGKITLPLDALWGPDT